ncbi:MAG: IclR family transcriptional regulator [Desulfovibrionaceae bacterium]|nr:IclR family transcriptional regulator [Desulfovibrionaceae bacterium]
MALSEKYYNIGVLGKAFGVIELMSHQAKWELKELARTTGLPKGTLQRILYTLCELGYVSQEKKGGMYSLTYSFFKLGQRIASNSNLADRVGPYCRQLMERVNETVNLCVALNMEMVVVVQQVSWQALRLDSIIGSSFPIFGSASGKVHCAFMDEKKLLDFLNELRRQNPDLSVEAINRFCEELNSVRREGVAFDFEEIFHGVRCVAAPIFDYTGNLCASIGISVPTVRITEESSENLIREIGLAAAKMSSVLGAPTRSFLPSSHTMMGTPAAPRSRDAQAAEN